MLQREVVVNDEYKGGSSAVGNKGLSPHGVGQKQSPFGGYRLTALPDYWKPTYVSVISKTSVAQSHLLLVFALSRHLTLHILRRIERKDIQHSVFYCHTDRSQPLPS